MDWQKVFIYDKERKKDLTCQVRSICIVDHSYYSVLFAKGNYTYSAGRILYLQNPEEIKTDGHIFLVNGKPLNSVRKALKFGSFYKFEEANGFIITAEASNTSIIKDIKDDKKVAEIINPIFD